MEALQKVVNKLGGPVADQVQAMNEIKMYRDKIGSFGSPLAMASLKTPSGTRSMHPGNYLMSRESSLSILNLFNYN